MRTVSAARKKRGLMQFRAIANKLCNIEYGVHNHNNTPSAMSMTRRGNVYPFAIVDDNNQIAFINNYFFRERLGVNWTDSP